MHKPPVIISTWSANANDYSIYFNGKRVGQATNTGMNNFGYENSIDTSLFSSPVLLNASPFSLRL